MALSTLVGNTVIKNDSSSTDTSVLEVAGKVIGLYFSAHWCPPCRAFTPQLVQWYEKFKSSPNGSKFDIIFLSSDRDEDQFKEYFEEMPWYAVPYKHRDLKTKAAKKFNVTGIPTLVFIDAESGNVVATNGRNIVIEDPEGEGFPWAPKSLKEIMSEGFLISNKDDKISWESVQREIDYVGIYFSAHWCGPCRSFTPQLVETYSKLKKDGEKFEIILCSSDRDDSSFKEYYRDMPWLAIPYGDNRKKYLSEMFRVSGIPTLIILDKDGEVINTSGRVAISHDPDGKEYPWKPSPVNMLTEATAGRLNESAVIFAFINTKTNRESLVSAMNSVATKYNDLLFFYSNPDSEEPCKSLQRFLKLTTNQTPLLILVDIRESLLFIYDGEYDVITEEMIKSTAENYKTGTLKLDSIQ